MVRLPTPGSDSGQWGDILNEFLSQAHTADGSLKTGSVTAGQLAPGAVVTVTLADGAVTNAKLDAPTQASLTKADSSLQTTSNLSDLASVATARTNLGLGTAATLAVGTSAGTVAAGDDSRIVAGGTASQPGHVHAASDVTSGTVATARLGSGSATSTTYLRGDQTWATPVDGSLRSRMLVAAALASGKTGLDLGVMASPPTITSGIASLDATLTKAYGASTTPTAFRTSGGIPTITSTTRWYFPVVTLPSGSGNLGGSISANGYAIEFVADADKVQLRLLRGTSTRAVIIEVDGRPVQSTSIAWTASGSTAYYLLTFASRAVRTIRVEMDQYGGFQGVDVGPTCSIWRPTSPSITVAVVGDSLTVETGATLPNGGYAYSTGKLLGWSDVRAVAIGGTGYISPGSNASTFGDATRVADVVACAPEMVIMVGSTNDLAYTAAAITSATLAAMIAYRTALPTTPIVVGGIYGGAGGPSSQCTTAEAAIKAAFDAWADPRSWWVPISTDTAGAWVYGTGKVGATNSSGNSDLYVGSDGLHPSQAGHDYYARRWMQALLHTVIPNL